MPMGQARKVGVHFGKKKITWGENESAYMETEAVSSQEKEFFASKGGNSRDTHNSNRMGGNRPYRDPAKKEKKIKNFWELGEN